MQADLLGRRQHPAQRACMDPGWDWRTLLRWASVAGVVESVIVMGLVERALIPPVLIVAILLLVGVVLLRGTGRTGVRVATIASGLFLAGNLLFASPSLVVP